MADRVSLTPTSYLVLGLVERMGPVTSYEMKQRVAVSVGYFWPFPHSQLYAEPARLERGGLLSAQVEPGGRRRRRYTVTATGRRALSKWLTAPTTESTEIRDLGLLKLFFSATVTDGDRRGLAADQRRQHEQRHGEYVALRELVTPLANEWELRTLEIGLRIEAAMAAFWQALERT
jgi:PadR family transcriptional regulator, regulatory protein AphA